MVTVFGLGFVGLTTAVGFAEKGFKVYGIDPAKEKTDLIKQGKLPFHEPGLDQALVRNLGKNFEVSENIKEAIKNSEYVYYCVGTPYGEGGQADLTYLYRAIEQTLEAIDDNKFRVLVTKSTIPPSTTSEKIVPFVQSKGYAVGEQLGVANNPEFLREGYCWEDFMGADRIVLGVSDERSAEMLRELYQPFDTPVFCVSLNTGEFIKYLSNTLLATLISYANEMSVVADVFGGIDVAQAFRILHMDKRWGGCSMTSYVYPGCGYGGYCLPKDTNALRSLSKARGYDPPILKNVIGINDGMPDVILERISKIARKDDRIGILGLSFKPGSDDVRSTPSEKIIEGLLQNGFSNIGAYDPMAIADYRKYIGHDIEYVEEYDDLCKESDVLVIATAWPEFADVRKKAQGKKIIDCRYMLLGDEYAK